MSTRRTTDFDGVVDLVKSKQVKVEGVILVVHEEDGSVTVLDTGDHVGRKGLGWGGGVGLLVGLFAPPLLASVAVGAAAGGVVGKFADHKLKTGLHDKIGEALPPGSAGIIAAFPEEHRLVIEQALPGAAALSLVHSDKKGLLRGLKGSLEEAMGKFQPDRTVLPLADPNFGGAIGRTLDKSAADWSINALPAPPEGAPNVLLVLIDDAGFGNPGAFGGPVATPTMTRVGEKGLTFNRFHVTAMCSPTRAATLDRTQQPRGRLRLAAGVPRPVPRLHLRLAALLYAVAARAPRQRLRDGRVRQVAPDPGPRPGSGGPPRPLADGLGLRPLLGVPRRRDRTVRPADRRGQHASSACPRGPPTSPTTCPRR